MYKQLVAFCVAFVLVFAVHSARAQWMQAVGPYGGTVSSLATNGSMLFAGTANSGVYRSMDSGAHWTQMNNGLTNTAINALIMSDGDLFAATNEGVFRSKDNAASWISINTALSNTRINSLTASGPNLFAQSYNGTIFTTNDGVSWQPTTAGLIEASGFVSDGQNLYASGWADSNLIGAISYSSDHGANWTVTNSGSTRSIESLVASGPYLFAFVWNHEVWRSSDNGKSWSYVGASPGTHTYSALSIGTTLIVGSDYGLHRSSDSGATWQSMSVTMPIRIYTQVNAVQSLGAYIFAGTYKHGVFRSSDNGATWQAVNGGLAASDIGSLGISNGSILAGVSDQGGIRSNDNGASWSAWNNDAPNLGINALFTRDKNILAATDSGIFRSRDDANTWRRITDSVDYVIKYINGFAQSDSFLFATSRSVKVLRSEDDGITWNNVYTPPAYGIMSIAASGSNICIATYELDVSHDNGATWQPNSDVPGASVVISSGTTFFAGTGSGVFRSVDGGTSWTQVSKGLTDTIVTSLFATGPYLFAGTQNGNVFLSTNDGAMWATVGTGLTTAAINALSADNKTLFAGTAGSSVWQRPLAEMIANSAVAQTRTAKQALSIYPNPSASSTTISFTPSSSGQAEITIVNLLGVEVARIFSGELDASEHRFVWNASTAPGVYECVINMNGKSSTQHLVVGN